MNRFLVLLRFTGAAALSYGLFGIPGLSAATYYMSTTGKDKNPGTLSEPFATLAKFNSIAVAGDTLLVRGGTYFPNETFITKSGTAGNPITIKNYPNEVPIFDGQRDNPAPGRTNGIVIDDGIYSGVDGQKHDLVFDGLVFINWKRSGLYFGDCAASRNKSYITCYNITVKNCVIDYCGQLGIRVTQADYIEIQNSMVSRTGWDINYGSWSSNINLYNAVGRNLAVRKCISFHAVDVSSYHTDGNGLILDMYEAYQTDAGAIVENSLFFENGGAGIAWTRSYHANLNNNTLYNNAREPSYIHPNVGLMLWKESFQPPFTDINLRNNLIWQEGEAPAYRAISGSNPETPSGVFTNNNITGLPGSADPLFVDPENWDFRLQANSPCIDAGASEGAPTASLHFDRKIIKSQTSGQPISWYLLAPDLDYITSRGGLANCFFDTSRSEGEGHDVGAIEYEVPGRGVDTGGPVPSVAASK